MNDHTLIAVCACLLGAMIMACYMAYVTITHGDGAVFGSVAMALGALLGVVVKAFYDHKRKK